MWKLHLVVILHLSLSVYCRHVPFSFNENQPIKKCHCLLCDVETTVGIVISNFCYYLNVNDRINYNNDQVTQFAVNQINDNINFADSIVSYLTVQFYSAFQHPYINLKFYESNIFEIFGVSHYDQCVKLDIASNKFIDDESGHCSPEPSILKTDQYEILYGWEKKANPEIYNNCNLFSNGVQIDGGKSCLFFDTRKCLIASINDVESFSIFEKFVVWHYYEHSKKECQKNRTYQSLDECLLGLFNKEYSSFIIHLNISAISERNSSNDYFHITGDKTGYFVVDVSRKKIYDVASYHDGMDLLLNRYKITDVHNLCSEVDEETTMISENTTKPYTQLTDMTTSEMDRLKVSRDSANLIICIITSVIIFLLFSAWITKRCLKKIDTTELFVH